MPVPDGDGTPTVRRAGREQLERIPSGLSRYDATHHAVGVATYGVEGDTATGDVTGVAHHLVADGGGDTAGSLGTSGALDTIWYLRYLDEYLRVDDRWLLARRALHLRGIERRHVTLLATGRTGAGPSSRRVRFGP